MVMSKFPRAPLLVGVVLGKAAELNFHLSLQLFGNFFFLRPIAFFIFFLIVLGLALPPILARRREMFASDFCAALLAMKTARPVRIVYSRAEEFIASRQRHPMSYPTKKGEYHVTRGN